MTDLKRHTPAGLRDLTPPLYAAQRAAARGIESLFEARGYRFISSPAIEYRAVFEGKGSVEASAMYAFPDRNGAMCVLRPDMTLAAARIAATHPTLRLGCETLRLCYIEKVFRNQARFQGKPGEFTQAGAELYGEDSPEADAEAVTLAVEALRAAGLHDFRVDIGQVNFLRGVLADSGLDEEARRRVMRALIAHDYVAVEDLVGAKHPVFSRLTFFIGGADVLARARESACGADARAALDHLETVYGLLGAKDVARYVLFDLAMAGHLDYYTGLLFRGYAPGAGYAVVEGGRYDRLLAAFGKPAPAVGFAIRLDGVLEALAAVPEAETDERAGTSGKDAALC